MLNLSLQGPSKQSSTCICTCLCNEGHSFFVAALRQCCRSPGGMFYTLFPVRHSLQRLSQCDAINGSISPQPWTTRCSFPIYIIALAACAGSPSIFLPVVPFQIGTPTSLVANRFGSSQSASTNTFGLNTGTPGYLSSLQKWGYLTGRFD